MKREHLIRLIERHNMRFGEKRKASVEQAMKLVVEELGDIIEFLAKSEGSD